jgi:hypothetical protein
MEIDKYWGIQTNDIVKGGWHVNEHYAHIFFFNFLRFSYSYLLARKARTIGLDTKDKKSLPADFNVVLKTYDLLGDVHNTFFRYWWKRNGHEVFGLPYEKPIAQAITLIDDLSKKKSNHENEVMNFLKQHSLINRQGKFLIMSIPIEQSTKESLDQVNKFLMQYKDSVKGDDKIIKPKLKLYGKRFNPKAMMKGVGLLRVKSKYPDIENWRLGVMANISDSYSPVLNKSATRETRDAIEAGDRILLGKITYRSLDKYQKIAENAARGKFMCSDNLPMIAYDWKAIDTQYAKTIKWEDKELNRLKAKSSS